MKAEVVKIFLANNKIAVTDVIQINKKMYVISRSAISSLLHVSVLIASCRLFLCDFA